MTPAEFATHLDGVVARGNGRWYARCPAPEDRSPPLSIADGEDRARVEVARLRLAAVRGEAA